jgi:hypothetical protein
VFDGEEHSGLQGDANWTTFERVYVFVGVTLISILGLWTCHASKDYRDARASYFVAEKAPLEPVKQAPAPVRPSRGQATVSE